MVYKLQATNENNGTWGQKLNAVLSTIDLNLGGRNNKSVAGAADVVLTDDEAEGIYQHFVGVLTDNIDVIFPASRGSIYIINNGTTGSFSITVKPAGGTGVVVPQ